LNTSNISEACTNFELVCAREQTLTTIKLNIKSGDLIEWVYKSNGELVVEREFLWSTIEREYVYIGREFVHMCINVDDETISWLNEKGLFYACVNDMDWAINSELYRKVVPRVRN